MAQVDVFQDPLEENWKLVQKLMPFKTITVAHMANHQKMTPLKTPALDYSVFILHGRHPSN